MKELKPLCSHMLTAQQQSFQSEAALHKGPSVDMGKSVLSDKNRVLIAHGDTWTLWESAPGTLSSKSMLRHCSAPGNNSCVWAPDHLGNRAAHASMSQRKLLDACCFAYCLFLKRNSEKPSRTGCTFSKFCPRLQKLVNTYVILEPKENARRHSAL